MKIRTKVILSTSIVLILIGGIGSVFLFNYRKIPRRFEQIRTVTMLIEEIFTLNLAVTEFYFYDRQQARRQWEKGDVQVQALLNTLTENSVTDAKLTQNLTELHEETQLLFNNLLAVDKNDEASIRKIVPQIHVQLENMVLYARLLVANIQAQLDRTQRRADALISLFLIGIVSIIAIVYFLFDRTILKPVLALQRGAKIVGQGNLEYQVPSGGNDELGQLTNSFNAMTKNLNSLSRARDEFLSAAAHELKTPLTVIRTYVQLMQEGSPEERQEWLQEGSGIINYQISRMNKLVQDLLETSRLQLKRFDLHVELVNFSELILNVHKEMQAIAPRHQLLIKENEPNQICVDPNRIEQVLINLLDNAIKYAPSGGKIEIAQKRENGDVVVCIKDYGIGVPADKQARMFEKFYSPHRGTAYEHVTSMGVGLYLSREFVRAHNGKIWFTSEEGVGSTFCFSIPIIEEC